MAVDSFVSIGEIHQARKDEGREIRKKVLADSREFDTELRYAVTKQHAGERRLALESLHEFRRSHPTSTVEVRATTSWFYFRVHRDSPMTLSLASYGPSTGS